MIPNNFYAQLESHFNKLPASAKPENIKHSFSPFQITLPYQILKDIKKTVEQIYSWSLHQPFSSKFLSISSPHLNESSVLMSYDFHITPSNQIKLIEINTNASGFLVVDLINKIHGLSTPALDQLRKSFFKEWQVFSQNQNISKSIPEKAAIIDENIEEQKMKFEFFMYQDLMNSWNWNNEVLDVQQTTTRQDGKLITQKGEEIDFVYNRLTDFYFEKFAHIRKAYKERKTFFNPQPKEYDLLANKKNLCQLSSYVFQNQKLIPGVDAHFLKKIIIKTWKVKSWQEVWNQRKNLFFKPLQSYGGKASYRGSTVTQKKLSQIENLIAQEYIPAGRWVDPEQNDWKFDIRAYVYRDQVSLVGARLYKGQITNFANPLGGFASVLFY